MALQNIGAGNRDDAFYRYKMPKMITKIEGRGNGIKTNVVNMVDIAKALARPASYTTKYFGCELGAQSKFDDKTGVSIVNGAHDTPKLAGLLENFIKKYVQCYNCGNPETEIIITKTQVITLKCAACGFVSDVDMRDKLTTFILKNPPEAKKASKDKKAMRRAEKERLKEGEAADEEQKKTKKETTKKKPAAPPKDVSKPVASNKNKATNSDGEAADTRLPEDDDDGDVQWQTDTSLEAARQRIQEQLSAVTAEMVMLSTDAAEAEAAAAAGAAEEKKPKQVKKGADSNVDDEKKPAMTEMKAALKKGSTPGQVASLFSSLPGTPQQRMSALFEALFDGVRQKGFAEEVARKKSYLGKVVQGEVQQQMCLLHAMEAFCAKAAGEAAAKEVALAAKALYDGDVVEEESIVRWYEGGAAGANKTSVIWKKMKPFVEWLQSAESESDE